MLQSDLMTTKTTSHFRLDGFTVRAVFNFNSKETAHGLRERVRDC